MLSEGPAREGTAKLAASGPQGCAQASAAPAHPAGQDRRAAPRRVVRLAECAPVRAPQARPPGPRKTGAGPASRPDPVPSWPRPPPPAAPRRAPRPVAPAYALAPSALYGMAAWPAARALGRHGCPLRLLVGAVRGGVWGLYPMPRECCSLHIRCFLEVLKLP